MSKIKSKDLSYDSSLPPFLQRLHDQKAGRGDTDRHEQPVARARRAKDPNEDDGPTVVDESGETVSKEEYEKVSRQNGDGIDDTSSVKGPADPTAEPKMSGALPEGTTDAKQDGARSEAKVTDGTAHKKRKAAKVVGADDEAEDAEGDTTSTKKIAKKAKKKSKVKLAFDEEEGG
ncbi:hypothetical protein Slin14017_G100990 [Septoria linicola]|nr:hypothetical protein Slin14017_G100990 [Septoria linicola]